MLDRRAILGALAAVGAGTALGPVAGFVPPAVRPREPWSSFAKGPHYAAFVKAVGKLKADTDPESPDNLRFWADIHQHFCPHGKDYFLAWHRGYLFLFEAKLRELSGVDALRLPYWDYFAAPAIPAEFTKGNGVSNPLYEPRKGSGVKPALGYAAFQPGVTAFQRGLDGAFEAKIEGSPHNNVHNLVGGKMATMQSPLDLLFWLHHANVDRLWSAWIAAGQGRTMPPPQADYWKGRFEFPAGLVFDRNRALGCEALGYRYADLALPAPPPPIVRSVAPGAEGGVPLPRVGAAPGPRLLGNTGAEELSLGEESVTVGTPLVTVHRLEGAAPPIPRVGAAPGGGKRANAAPPPELESVREQLVLVLEEVTLTEIGTEGGFFYKIYAGLTGQGFDEDERRLLGTIGPFQIAAAMHHAGMGAARIEIPATEVVKRLVSEQGALKTPTLALSFVRINADGAPAGKVIGIGRYRIEGALEG
ncbi:tyrosinase family protein [Sphingomonas sp. LB-2]|uniref:tyrosinase family protein n=1 Tax=Sphingomonas caeni TaxID=2984949 RepID=UPI00223006A0|nr:tyrosinase family protein [Sphingomonas caeni]MCW3848404.1 tyrosinase family protein [Sphingomonas caeni]